MIKYFDKDPTVVFTNSAQWKENEKSVEYHTGDFVEVYAIAEELSTYNHIMKIICIMKQPNNNIDFHCQYYRYNIILVIMH